MSKTLGEPFEAHLSIVLYNLGESLVGQGKWRESAPTFEESLTLSKRKLGSKHVRTISILNALGNVHMMLGDDDGAEGLLQEALASARESAPTDIQLAHVLAGLSALRLRQNKPEEALPPLRDVLETHRLEMENGATAEDLETWMRAEAPNFSPAAYGFQEFSEFLNYAQDKLVVRVQPDEEKGLVVYLGAEFYPPAGLEPPPKETHEPEEDEKQPIVEGQPSLLEPNPPPPKPKPIRRPRKVAASGNIADRPRRSQKKKPEQIHHTMQ